MNKVIELSQVHQQFNLGKVIVPALRGVDLDVSSGEFVALVGASGSGKSTLLNIIGGLCRSTSGMVKVQGVSLAELTENQLCLFRRKHIGFIFQSFNLISNLTALENVELPLIFSGISKAERRKRAEEILEVVGLTDRKKHKPNELSGGQQQRVSIARAMVQHPDILLADEPTGNLDSTTSREIMEFMKQMNEELKMTLVMVTHDREMAKYAHRVVHLKDGRIIKEEDNQEASI